MRASADRNCLTLISSSGSPLPCVLLKAWYSGTTVRTVPRPADAAKKAAKMSRTDLRTAVWLARRTHCGHAA